MANFEYYIRGLDGSFVGQVKEKIESIQQVKNCEISTSKSGYKLVYTLGEQVAEYDIFVEVCSIVQSFGADVDFTDEVVKEKKVLPKENAQDNSDKQAESDNAKSAKKSHKIKIPDYLPRIIELCVALLIYAIFGFENIMFTGLILVLAAYEIFYRAICDILDKKITDSVVFSLSFILMAFSSDFKTLLFVALAFSVLQMAYDFVLMTLKKKNIPLHLNSNLEKSDGSSISLTDVKKGDELNIKGFVPISLSVVEGEGIVNRGETSYEIEVGDLLELGDVIEKKKTIVCRAEEDYSLSKTQKRYEKEQAIEEYCARLEKPSKKALIVATVMFAIGLLLAFIMPAFNDYGYRYGLGVWLIRASVLTTLSLPINMLWQVVSVHFSLQLLTKKCNVENLEKVLEISQKEKIVYDERVFLSGDKLKDDSYGILRELKDAKVKKQIIISLDKSKTIEQTCNSLNVKTYYNAPDKQTLENILSDAVFVSVNDSGEVVIDSDRVASFSGDKLRVLPYIYKQSKKYYGNKVLAISLSAVANISLIIIALIGLLSALTCIVIALCVNALIGLSETYKKLEI